MHIDIYQSPKYIHTYTHTYRHLPISRSGHRVVGSQLQRVDHCVFVCVCARAYSCVCVCARARVRVRAPACARIYVCMHVIVLM